MRHILAYLAVSIFILSCGNPKKETLKKDTPIADTTTATNPHNYAVVWKWRTTNTQLIRENAQVISKELRSLWQQGKVQNAYYNATAKADRLSNFPNISFTIKAKSLFDARSTLNQLTVVQKSIASYQLFPTGILWLGRKHEIINQNGPTKSFATVWTTVQKPSPSLTQEQNDSILSLWKHGKIENVYFDIEGTQKQNNTSDFVFYVNANTVEAAKTVCESLPFFTNQIARYKIYDVGVFWMGTK